MRAKKLFSILLAMMLMLFTLFPIQAVLAETTNQPSQTTSTAESPASSAVPTQRSDTPAPTSGANPVWKHLWTCRGSWVFLFSSMG